MKVLLLKNDNYIECGYPQKSIIHIIAIPVDMALSALRDTRSVSLYSNAPANGLGYENGKEYRTTLTQNLHNGKDWIGGIEDGEDWLLPEDLNHYCMWAENEDGTIHSDQTKYCHTLTIRECAPTEKALKKALKVQGWSVLSMIPKKYLMYGT